jgi:hypothetical protein
VGEEIEFSPRYQTGPDGRYRIARQNRQRANQSRHPAWRSERGFPRAADDVAGKDDPSMPDLTFLKLIVARTDDGRYLADYVNAGALPAGCPTALELLFRSNAVSESGLDETELRSIVQRSHGGSADGRPTAPEIEDVRDRTAEGAGRRTRRGQGYRQSSEERMALDRHAMGIAKDHFEADGWKVHDKSINNPYDLLCVKGTTSLHVEVKGTTSDGRAVLLTPNEVVHAQAEFPNVALFVVHGIDLRHEDGAEPETSGGTVDLTNPWDIGADGTLTATGYSYERH